MRDVKRNKRKTVYILFTNFILPWKLSNSLETTGATRPDGIYRLIYYIHYNKF